MIKLYDNTLPGNLRQIVGSNRQIEDQHKLFLTEQYSKSTESPGFILHMDSDPVYLLWNACSARFFPSVERASGARREYERVFYFDMVAFLSQ